MKVKNSTLVIFEGKSRYYRGKLKPQTLKKLKNKGALTAFTVSIDEHAPDRGFFNKTRIHF
jgi:hypothetical protein